LRLACYFKKKHNDFRKYNLVLGGMELVIGARGWNFDHWQSSFYPEDLPEDWRFSYYSNEFHSILVPWETLQGVNANQTQGWLDDVDEDFVFFVEVALHLSWEEVWPVIKPLLPQLGGIYLRAVDDVRIRPVDEAVVERLLRKAKAAAPVIVDHKAMDTRINAIAARYEAGCYWQPDSDHLTQCPAQIAIAEITMRQHHPKSLKKIIEDCCSVQGPTTIGFFMGGEMPDIEDLRNATIIWQMLT
jgi:hypothetical protein